MSWLTIGLLIYSGGFIFTLVFNVLILAVVIYPLSILRNALLWPFCLPFLVILWMNEGQI